MHADLILTNGRIYTVDPRQPWAEALACHNGRFIAVGSNAQIEALAGPQTTRLNGNGRLVLPGFIDAHIHFLQVAARRQQVNLFGVADMDELLHKVATAVAHTPPGQWVKGWGWDENLWGGGQPTAALLDKVAPHTPVVLARMDMHTWWVNSAVLERAHITAETADPPESSIGRDSSGQPNGLLREWNALDLVQPLIPQPDEETLYEWLQAAIHDAHRLGLTGIHDQRIEREGAQSARLWQRLNREGKLNLRVHMHLAADFIDEAATLGLQPGFGDERLWLGHVKAFADGTMGSHTAHMLQPFENEPDNTGIVVTSAEELWQLALAAGDAGFPLSVHAIGDRAGREVLDVFHEHLATPSGRALLLPHRIEHVQIIHPDDIPRLAHPGIVTSMQPYHLMTDWQTAVAVWGERTRTSFAFQSMLDAGATLAFGSDAPVAPLDPWAGLFAAVARQDLAQQPAGGWHPKQKLSLAAAIWAYTMGGATVAGKTAVQGSISPGKWADFIVLDRNLLAIAPAEILKTEVDVTVFASQVVYSRE